MQKQHVVRLSARERRRCQELTSKGRAGARVIKRARVLLLSHYGAGDADIAAQVGYDPRTVARIRARYCAEGIDRALEDAPRSGQPPKITDRIEAHLVAIACTDPPKGAARWTLTLLRERLITDKLLTHISLNAIYEHLTERGIKPWREKNVVHPDGG